MNRREMITAGAGILAAGILKSGAAYAASSSPKSTHSATGGKSSLMDAALDCIAAGDSPSTLSGPAWRGRQVDGGMLQTVTEMLTVCKALVELAAQKSAHLAKFAAICGDVCKTCEKACRQHEMHMPICKACAESCACCAAECAEGSGIRKARPEIRL